MFAAAAAAADVVDWPQQLPPVTDSDECERSWRNWHDLLDSN